MKITRILISLVTVVSLFVSCQSDDDNSSIDSGSIPEERIIVSHEGASVSGSTSVVSLDLKTVNNKFYDTVNGEELGVFQQSIGFNGDKAYIVVDNQNTITVVDKVSFVKQATITEKLKTPRYIAFANGKGYVTNWGDTSLATDDFVAVVDLTSNVVENTIAVAEGPEQSVIKGNKLYVSHKGGFGINNRVSVIDLSTSNVKEIETLFLPDEMVLVGDDLWVSCEGTPVWRPEGESIGGLIKIDTRTDEITSSIEFPLGQHTSQMVFENGNIYYTVSNEIFELAVTETTLPTTAITEGAINGMAIKEGVIYVVDAKDFASGGTLNTYNLNEKKWGTPVTVGVAPAKIYFQ